MIRDQIAVTPLLREFTEVKIIERSWGIERCYLTPDGQKVCTPTPFSTNYRNLDWSLCA